MTGNYKVSIIVPIYNVEKYLEKCIVSLMEQTYKKIEIILIDDGSKDSSGIICDQYAKRDSRILVIHKKNGGLSSSRAAGIDAASGEYIMIVDGDDWIEPNTVEICISKIKNNSSVDCVLFSYIKEFSRSSVSMHILDSSKMFSPEEAEDKVYRRLFGLSDYELNHPERMDNIVSCCMKLYKSDIARKGRFFDNRVVGSCEDALFNMYALHNCKSIIYIDECFYHYRKIETSLTNAYRKDLDKKWRVLFSEMESIIQQKELPIKYENALLNRVALSIIGIGMNEVGNKEEPHSKRIKRVRKYLKSESYQKACEKLKIRNMPLIWKVFFLCCKFQMSISVYLMLLSMMQLRKH